MKRWVSSRGKQVDAPNVDAFIAEVIEVSKRHGLSIRHEGGHGAFIIGPYREDDADWLSGAFISEEGIA